MSTNPLGEILEAALKKEEPLLDSDWPAGNLPRLANPQPSRRPSDESFLRPVVRVRP